MTCHRVLALMSLLVCVLGALVVLPWECFASGKGGTVAEAPDKAETPSAALDEMLLALDPATVTEREIAEVLSHYPAPRIIALNGSIPIVTMEAFTKFLALMGYPERSIRAPGNGGSTYSSYRSSKDLAGLIAWYYEKDGVMPVLIGHSQGGGVVIKVLHELTGAFNEQIPVWNPLTGQAEQRTTIIDPRTGWERPVVGLQVGFASAIATGKLMRVILGQWSMLGKLRKIPDSVEEFTGYHIPFDFLSGTLFGVGKGSEYRATGSATVHNIVLPSHYSHTELPLVENLARNPEARQWIDTYLPAQKAPNLPEKLRAGTDNILFAADIWHRIKKQWCIEAQRFAEARLEGTGGVDGVDR